ncbi:DnaJ sub C member 12 [Coemansia sp. RSA 2598]|nr:DnaJ sub C member 12 [Coemansia sp. RSA 2598]
MDLDTQHNAQTQVPDYYDVLRCSPRSTQDQIHREYRQLALQHHPDKSAGDSQWDVIREAYETIGDDLKRAQYDRWRMAKLPVPFKQWVKSQAHAVHWAFDYQRAIQSDQKRWWDERERREGDLYQKFRNYEV